ncbi:rhomboid family intramembrane serine protease [Dethiobacter alkaliphilus]|uniref:rhomboid family intramembrane serine protease n=1 Tax=Dethiobacter alkaliphilus TaxID=427926 RepID=UPI002226C2AC|nr:hypothetical protein [Dethiobacter alkaliphilus]MCW3489820.1 hypothetical protein [Dethiobacter alkaliphilus]
MKWINKLERKYGRYGIRNLMQFIVLGNALIFLLMQMDPRIPSLLAMHPALVMQGEVWRLISFIFIPPTTSLFFAFFVLYFYYMVGTGLEHEWGTFKFNVFYLAGILGTVIASFITGSVANAVYINMALFLGFARIYPDYQILLMLILPIKVKYLAWLNWGIIGFNLIFGTFPVKIMSLVPVALYLLFFGGELSTDVKRQRQIQQNRKRFFSEIEKAKKNQKRE